MLGLTVVIKNPRRKGGLAASYDDEDDCSLVHEIKRVGFLIDRYVDL